MGVTQQVKSIDPDLLKILDKELQRLSSLIEHAKDTETKKFAAERIKVIQGKLLDYLDCLKK
jgi:hypothetical protein